MRLENMKDISLVQRKDDRGVFIARLAERERVRDLASFLGIGSQAIAEGLVEAVERDPSLRHLGHVHRAA